VIEFFGTFAGAPIWAWALIIAAWTLRYIAKHEMHPIFEGGFGE